MKKSIISLLALFCVSSCCDNAPEKPELTPEQLTAESFKNPITIGTLPDGRVLQKVYYYRSNWSMGQEIFLIGSSTVYEVREGKSSRTTVVIEAPPKE